MERIPNILPGSRVSVWVYNKILKESRQITVTVTDEGHLQGDDQLYGWAEVGATPKEALQIYTDALRRFFNEVQSELWRAEREMIEKYPCHPRLTEDEFRVKYPNLSPSIRLEDQSPVMLEYMDRQANWQTRKYDEPA